MYANENKGRFCLPVSTGSPVGNANFAWYSNSMPFRSTGCPYDVTTGMLWRYVKDKQVYICPDDPQENVIVGTPVARHAPSGFSYGQNAVLGGTQVRANGQGVDRHAPSYSTLSQIRHAERTMLMIERADAVGNNYTVAETPIYYANTLIGGYLFAKLHLGSNSWPIGCSVSFVDGHAMFWTYATDVRTEDAPLPIAPSGPDLMQLAAWTGSEQTPPGVTP